jgi:hypothetical protein
MKTNKQVEKEKLWRNRLEKAATFSGSNREFCQSQGISIHTFQYWRSKLNNETQSIRRTNTTPFIKVEIEEPISKLPDPHWLAELVLSLSRGSR